MQFKNGTFAPAQASCNVNFVCDYDYHSTKRLSSNLFVELVSAFKLELSYNQIKPVRHVIFFLKVF